MTRVGDSSSGRAGEDSARLVEVLFNSVLMFGALQLIQISDQGLSLYRQLD
jgi:hypothetical protein